MTSFVNKNMQSNNAPGPPTLQDSRSPYTNSAVKGGTLSHRRIPRAMEDRMTGTAGDERRNGFHLWRANLFEIPRGFDFDFDQTYIIIEWFRHCTMEHWSNMYCSYRHLSFVGRDFSCEKGLPVMGYFFAVRVL